LRVIAVSPYDFRNWQIAHYTDRLAQATRIEERSFLRRELFNLKKPSYEPTVAIPGLLAPTLFSGGNDPVVFTGSALES
jgi:hypothetical protein